MKTYSILLTTMNLLLLAAADTESHGGGPFGSPTYWGWLLLLLILLGIIGYFLFYAGTDEDDAPASSPRDKKPAEPEAKPTAVPAAAVASSTAVTESLAEKTPEPVPAPKPEPEAATKPLPEPEPKQVPVAEPAITEATVAATLEGVEKDEKLGLLYKEAPKDPDVLTQMSGVGPVLQRKLNEFGVYRFEQIAAWSPEVIAEFSERLSFKGRVEREQWVEQARAIVKAR